MSELVQICVIAILLDVVIKSEGDLRLKLDNDCRQPLGDVCMEIRKCPFFSELLDRTTIPRPRHVIKIIRDHHCGFDGSTPKVCCPTTDKESQELSHEPDLMKHENLKLVPLDRCGAISNAFRIISGSKTVPLEFPWMALIAYKTDEGLEFRCGGTVINKRYVLTAAHCIQNMTLIGVRLGEHNINTINDCDPIKGTCAPPVQDFKIEEVVIHPGYVPIGYENDIALIRLANPANFSYANVQPICLPIGNPMVFKLEGKFAVVSGWGVTEDGFKSPVLLKTSIPVVPNKECKRLYLHHSAITEKQICAGGYLGRDSCGGDSGGPLKYVGHVEGTARYIQYGIVSYGPRHCGTIGQPGVYTRISFYMNWILDNLKPST